MKLRCSFHIKRDGSVDVAWKNQDIIEGGPEPKVAEMIRAYVSYALLFASQTGGLEVAYRWMQSQIMKLREIAAEENAKAEAETSAT